MSIMARSLFLSAICWMWLMAEGITQLMLQNYRPYPGRPVTPLYPRFAACCNPVPVKHYESLPVYRFSTLPTINEISHYQNPTQNENTLQNTVYSGKAAEILKEFLVLTNENIERVTKIIPEANSVDSTRNHLAISVELAQEEDDKPDDKAIQCAQLVCGADELKGPLCACNDKTGNTVSFKNECDVKKHNCRFNTAFKTILHDICPWQYVSRSGDVSQDLTFSYDDPKYFN